MKLRTVNVQIFHKIIFHIRTIFKNNWRTIGACNETGDIDKLYFNILELI